MLSTYLLDEHVEVLWNLWCKAYLNLSVSL
jgi:hypothetical protein